MKDASFWMTAILAVLFATAGLRWFIRLAGSSGPRFITRVDVLAITGVALACWVGYLAINALLPLLIAIAFAVGVELYVRESRRRWLDANVPAASQAEPVQPETAEARRIREPARLIALPRGRLRLLPSLDERRPALAPPTVQHHEAGRRIPG